MKKSKKGNILVLAQFACLILLVLIDGPFIPRFWTVVFHLLGLGLALWAVKSMGLGNTHIHPDTHANSYFVNSGPYRKIRHPMYTALLLYFFPYLVLSPLAAKATYLALLITLLIKLNFEEQQLKERFPEYPEYCRNTFRLLLGLY